MKIKVLHVITRLVVGGAQENTLFTVRLSNHEKYDTILVSGPSKDDEEGSLEGEALNAGVNLIIIDELVRNLNPVKDLIAFFRLFCLMKKGKFDIVHTHCSKAGILGRFAARLAGVSIIIHTPHGHVFYGYFDRFTSWFFIILERIAGSFTDRIITLTERGREEHILYKIGKPDKFITIHSGIDLKNFKNIAVDRERKRKELGLSKDDFVIGTIARLTEIKGHSYLIDAVPEILKSAKNAKFLLVGDGPLKPELQKQAAELNVSGSVLFLGIRKDIPELISVMDLFILPSLNEGMGKVFLQVQAMGKAVIASDVGGVREIVKDGENGILVPPKDSSAIAKACVELCRNDKKRTGMGENGRTAIDGKYSIEAMVNSIEALYDSLIKTKIKEGV